MRRLAPADFRVLVSWGFRDKELLESFDAEKVVDNVKDLREFLFDFTQK